MKTSRFVLMLLVPAALAMSGCESQPMRDLHKVFQAKPEAVAAAPVQEEETAPVAEAPSKGQLELQAGVKRYEDGKYAEASTRLHNAIAEGLTPEEAVTAHKYLAFIHCASRRERQCRTEFRKALQLNPAFQLEAAEAGHPIWGRVFRDVKERG